MKRRRNRHREKHRVIWSMKLKSQSAKCSFSPIHLNFYWRIWSTDKTFLSFTRRFNALRWRYSISHGRFSIKIARVLTSTSWLWSWGTSCRPFSTSKRPQNFSERFSEKLLTRGTQSLRIALTPRLPSPSPKSTQTSFSSRGNPPKSSKRSRSASPLTSPSSTNSGNSSKCTAVSNRF